MSATTGGFVQAIGWMLIHSLWQGAVLAAAAAVFMRLSGVQSARARYLTHCLALVALVTWAGVTFGSQWQLSQRAGINRVSNEPVITQAPPLQLLASNSPDSATTSKLNLDALMPVLVALWGFGVCVMSARLAFASNCVRRLRKTATPWADDQWQRRFQSMRAELGIDRAVELCLTKLSEVPAVIGHFRPMLLIPAALITQVSPDQLEAVILHELMHIRRGDYLVNLLQLLCETVFFFNPAAWWISRQIRLERECCCDELVVHRSGDKLGYAKALLRMEELRTVSVSQMVLASTGGPLKQRISRLLVPRGSAETVSGWSSLVGVALLVLALTALAWPRANAQVQPEAKFFELRLVVAEGTTGAEAMNLSRNGVDERLWVAKNALLNTTHIAAAEAVDDPLSKSPQVSIRLTKSGADLFEKVTGENVGKRLAIVVGGKVISAPRLAERITGDKMAISGNFTHAEAEDLARKLQPQRGAKKEAWSPADDALPSAVLKEVRADIDQRRYEDALKKMIWYHTASRYETGQGGVRLSFALSDWRDLGRRYPPALQKMKQMRDEKAVLLRNFDRTESPFTIFQEYAVMNETLDESFETARLFAWLDQNDPKVAKTVFSVAQPALIKARMLSVCAKYIQPADIDRFIGNLELNEKMAAQQGTNGQHLREFAQKKFRNDSTTLIALLVAEGKADQARSIADKTTATQNDLETIRAVESALRGQVPDPWPLGGSQGRSGSSTALSF